MNRLMSRVRGEHGRTAVIALLLAAALIGMPGSSELVSGGSAPSVASAAYCGNSVGLSGVTATGTASCGGAYYMDHQVCIRKQRSLQPDGSWCSGVNWRFLYGSTLSKYHCDGSGNYRGRSTVYYNLTGNTDTQKETAWYYRSC